MGQILSGLGGQYGGGSQYGGGGRRPVGGGQNSGGNPNYIGAPRGYDPTGGVNGPNGNWPGYYLGGGGALPNSGPTSDRANPYPYGGGGSPASDPLGNPLGGMKGHAYVPTPNEKDPYGLPGGSGGGAPKEGIVGSDPGTQKPVGSYGVEATPDPLGPMTMGNEGGVDPKSRPQNPMRRSKGWEQRS